MTYVDVNVCVICGSFVATKDLYEDTDKLKNTWIFHRKCFDTFVAKDYTRKK